MTSDELDILEGVAMMADDEGRPWVHRPNDNGYPQQIIRKGDVALIAQCYDAPKYPPLTADFITTFDPPTVLALIAAARKGRQP